MNNIHLRVKTGLPKLTEDQAQELTERYRAAHQKEEETRVALKHLTDYVLQEGLVELLEVNTHLIVSALTSRKPS